MQKHTPQPDFTAAHNPILRARSGDQSSYERARGWRGLPLEATNRWTLIRAAEDALPLLGVSAGAISYFRLIARYTQEQDWEETSEPIIYLSVTRIAEELNRSTRQIRTYERQLQDVGVLVWRSTDNHRRYGRRDESGRIVYAYGVSLAPIAVRYAEFVELVAAHRAREAERRQELRRVRCLRGALRTVLADDIGDLTAEVLDDGVELLRITETRKMVGRSRGELTAIRERIERVLWQVHDTRKTANSDEDNSAKTEENFAHNNNYNTTPEFLSEGNHEVTAPNGADSLFAPEPANAGNRFEGKREAENPPDNPNPADAGRIYDCGVDHVSMAQVRGIMGSASREFLSNRIGRREVTWADITGVAGEIAPMLGINASAVIEANSTLGRVAAAVAILITERRYERGEVRSPGGYLRGMLSKAVRDELHLHRTIFGLLERGVDADH